MTPGLLFFYPLSDTRFLLVDRSAQGFEFEGQRHLFVLASLDDKGSLTIRGPLDLGFSEPSFQRKFVDGRRQWVPNPKALWQFSALSHAPFFTVGDEPVLGFFSTGIYLVLDGQGRRLKTLRLFPGLDDDRIADHDSYDRPVLCAQPRQDGTLLIASRSEDATLRGRRAFARKYTLEGFKDPRERARLDEADTLSLKNFPHVLWWVLDPKAKTLEPTLSPERVPDRIYDIPTYKKFWFTMDAQGNLVFPK
ncbi:MAG: hypothetical protein HY823_15240 [Acidobacteria bacterium]|nr:hypothetical protein [Acidobacteriota bacterium]